MDIKRVLTFVDEVRTEAGQRVDPPLRKVAVVAVIDNPFAGRFEPDLKPLTDASAGIGRHICGLAVALLGQQPESYGKAAVIGINGEQEHGVAMLTTVFGNVMRDAAGGGKAWISSFTKRAAPGAAIDIPLAHKDALYVRSHYDGITITLPDAPLPDEIAVICAYANRGRPNHRVGGLNVRDIKGLDGLTCEAIMSCKTGAEHIKSLQDGRTVYLDGKLVGDVTVHPAFRNAVKSAAMLYDFQAQPENIELMTFKPNGANRRVNRAWQMPRNYAEMVQRRKAMQAWAQLSYGFMGRSPDHLASSVIGQVMGIEVFEKHGPARAKALRDYYEEASRNDWFLTYVIINPQAERGQGLGRAGRGPGRAASSTRMPAASRSAAQRCSAPRRSWRTRCSSRTCSR